MKNIQISNSLSKAFKNAQKNVSKFFAQKRVSTQEVAKIKNTEKVLSAIHSLEKKYTLQIRQEITDLQLARAIAEHPLTPFRWRLMLVYKDMLQNDAHLSAVVRKRILKVTSRKLKVVDSQGKKKDDLTLELNRKWLKDFVEASMESIFYGYTLIGLQPVEDLGFKVIKFPRENVSPEKSVIVYDYTAQSYNGIQFTEDTIKDFFIFVQGFDGDLGILNTAAPFTISKRHSFGAWGEFEQIYGVPIRTAYTSSNNPKVRNEIESWLEDMGLASYALFPEGTRLEIIANPGTGNSDIFDRKIEVLDKQVSKLILGNTMTLDEGSSRSQGEVHERSEDEITKDDLTEILFVLNDELLPRLRKFGYNFAEGDRFAFDEKADLKARMEIDKNMLSRLSDEYLEETYNVKIRKEETTTSIPLNAVAQLKKKEFLRSKLNAFKRTSKVDTHYNKEYCSSCSDKYVAVLETPDNISVINQIITFLHDNPNSEVPENLIQELSESYVSVFESAITEGYGTENILIEDENMINVLRQNVQVFGAAKTESELRQMTNLLYDSDGSLRTFQEFRFDALKLHENYNVNWLKAEYNVSVNSSIAARKWVEIERDKEIFPLLKYITAGDDRVRSNHEKLDNKILPQNDDFWNTYYPPNGWNCRCTVQKIRKGEISKDVPNIEINQMFQNNVGKNGIIFPKKHPYFNS
ncbi:DUF935 family protein [Bernardetia sp. Wsw4-3y2]|uniref:phage portal protein family protein n=1 Tax=Bernardetia sp. Wsw4-3y2 TaxID=3127471 RepID=UPI0030D16676